MTNLGKSFEQTKANGQEARQKTKSLRKQIKLTQQWALSSLIEYARDFQDEVNRQEPQGKILLEPSVAQFMAVELRRISKIIDQALDDLADYENYAKKSRIVLSKWIQIQGNQSSKEWMDLDSETLEVLELWAELEAKIS